MPAQDLSRNINADAIIGGAGFTRFDAANAHLGVGDGTTAHATSQTQLQGASVTLKAMDSGFPSRTGRELTLQSTFGTAEGNHAWEEIGVFNGSTNGTDDMYARKVGNEGTKTNSASWELNHKLTFVHGSEV